MPLPGVWGGSRGCFWEAFGSIFKCRLGSQLEVRGAPQKVLEMRSSWFQNQPFGIIKNMENARDII